MVGVPDRVPSRREQANTGNVRRPILSTSVSGPSPGRSAQPCKFEELSVVHLSRTLEPGGRALPRGTSGTVVAVYGDGLAYEVEFFEPFHCVLTVESADLTA